MKRTESDFNILVLATVLIAISVISYAEQIRQAIRARRCSELLAKSSYTMRVVPELELKNYQERKILIVLHNGGKTYSYCKETTCNLR